MKVNANRELAAEAAALGVNLAALRCAIAAYQGEKVKKAELAKKRKLKKESSKIDGGIDVESDDNISEFVEIEDVIDELTNTRKGGGVVRHTAHPGDYQLVLTMQGEVIQEADVAKATAFAASLRPGRQVYVRNDAWLHVYTKTIGKWRYDIFSLHAPIISLPDAKKIIKALGIKDSRAMESLPRLIRWTANNFNGA